MLSSLIDIEMLPQKLGDELLKKSAGNPFYLKELVLALLENARDAGNEEQIQFPESLAKTDIPSSLQGLISSRLDRLSPVTRRIAMEASVIGRSFPQDLLDRVVADSLQLPAALSELEDFGLIHPAGTDRQGEYVFKNALVQEVSYKRLLRNERRRLHECIGMAVETLSENAIPQRDETLAYHYLRGTSIEKAVTYLMRSGENALQKHALADAHRYFKKAFELVHGKENRMIEIVNQWAFAFYYEGNNRTLLQLLERHRHRADNLDDLATRGMFYAWLGCAHWHKGDFNSAYRHLRHALRLGTAHCRGDIIGYARSWLGWVCTEIGRLEEAIHHARMAIETYETDGVEPYIYFNALAGMGYAFWHRGDKAAVRQAGKKLVAFGHARSNPRSRVLGHCCLGWSRLVAGQIESATRCFDRAVAVSTDPWYSQFPRLALVYGYASCGQIDAAEKNVGEILAFAKTSGINFLGAPAGFFDGLIRAVEGDLEAGEAAMERQLRQWENNGSRLRFASFARILGQTYAAAFAKSVGFKHLPAGTEAPPAARKALAWFEKSIAVAEQIGTYWALGNAYLNKGQLEALMNHGDAARVSISAALEIFKKYNIDLYREQAQKALAALGEP